jgi:hypothetical protein
MVPTRNTRPTCFNVRRPPIAKVSDICLKGLPHLASPPVMTTHCIWRASLRFATHTGPFGWELRGEGAHDCVIKLQSTPGSFGEVRRAQEDGGLPRVTVYEVLLAPNMPFHGYARSLKANESLGKMSVGIRKSAHAPTLRRGAKARTI